MDSDINLEKNTTQNNKMIKYGLPISLLIIMPVLFLKVVMIDGAWGGTLFRLCGDASCTELANAYFITLVITWFVTSVLPALMLFLIFKQRYGLILIVLILMAIPNLIFLLILRPSHVTSLISLISIFIKANWWNGSLQIIMMLIYGWTFLIGLLFKKPGEKLLQLEIVLFVSVVVIQTVFPGLVFEFQTNIEKQTILRTSHLPSGFMYYGLGRVINNKTYIHKLSSDGSDQSVETPYLCRDVIVSRDNRWFVCLKNGLWLQNLVTGERQLLSTGRARDYYFSPDSKYLYFTSLKTSFDPVASSSLSMYRYDHLELKNILSVEGEQYYESDVLYAATPNSDKVAVFILPFLTSKISTVAIIVMNNNDLTQKTLDVGCCYTIVKAAFIEHTRPRWSLDGNRLFFTLRDSSQKPTTKFVLYNFTDNSEISINLQDTVSEAIYDGKDSVYFLVCQDGGLYNCRTFDGESKLYKLNFSTKQTTFLKNVPATYTFRFLADGEWMFYEKGGGWMEKTEGNKKLLILNDFHDMLDWNN